MERAEPVEPPPPIVQPPEPPERAAPGTWREIIARFELDDLDDSARAETVPAEPLPAEPVSWEVEAMTTPDYTPPRSIHDPQHDSWPVDTPDGTAVPAWSDAEQEDIEAEASERAGEAGELVLDQVVSSEAWEDELEPAPGVADASVSRDFPLDAFIVPGGAHHAPSGYDAEVAQLVAHRLDELAQKLRDGGLGALGSTHSVDELSRVLAAIVAGYVVRDA